jgi:hypothetical protein
MSHHEFEMYVMVKILTSFSEWSASDSRLILQLGIALNKKMGRWQAETSARY